MITTAFERGSVQDGPEIAPITTEAVPPAELCGIPIEAIRRLGQAASDTCALPYPYGAVARGIQNIMPYTGLIETIISQPDREQAVAEHLPEIKKVAGDFVPGFRTIDRIATHVPPLGRRLDARVTRAVMEKSAELPTKLQETLPKVEAEVDFLSRLKNPREQFRTEVATLGQRIATASMAARDTRIQSGTEQPHGTPKGILGVVVRVVRGVKSFFGRLFGRGSRNTRHGEITAYDTGHGIATVLRELQQPVTQEPALPLLNRYVSPQLEKFNHVSPDQLALAAPEILEALYSISKSHEIAGLLRSTHKNPHELRIFTALKRNYGRYNLDRIQRASRTLLPAIRDILPTSGEQVRRSFEQMMRLLGIESSSMTPTSEESHEVAVNNKSRRQSLKVVLKRLFTPDPQPIPSVPKQASHPRQVREVLKAGKPSRQPWRVVLKRLFGR